MSDYQDDKRLDRRDFIQILSGGAFLLVSGGLLSGCGGASSSKPGSTASLAGSSVTAHAVIKIIWPPRPSGHVKSRLIPVASNVIKLDIANGSTPVTSQVISRPTDGTNISTVNFDTLPVGSLTVTANAYPDPGPAFGVAQATGTVKLSTRAGQQATMDISMVTTITTINIMPTSATVNVGGTTPLTANCLDSTGAMVLVTPATLQWSSSDNTLATVNESSGVVTGVMGGMTTITLKETESGKTAKATITIPKIIVTPENASVLSLGNGDPSTWPTIQFSATGGTPPYIWSIDNGMAGSFDANKPGLYTSQRHMATGTITAQDANGNEGTATVTVTTSDLFSGGASAGAFSVNVSDGTATPTSTGWRISAPIGKHILTLTNTSGDRQYHNLSFASYNTSTSFTFNGGAVAGSGFLNAGQSIDFPIERH